MPKRPSDRTALLADELVQKLASNPADESAYRALREHYLGGRDFASLVNLVVGFAAYTQSPEASALAYVEAGELATQQLADTRRAEEFYRTALQRHPSCARALELLETLLATQGRDADLQRVLEAELQRLQHGAAEPAELALVEYRLAELFEERFQQVDAALAHYRRAYELDPQLLRAIYNARSLHQQRGELREACLLYEREIAVEPDSTRRGALLRELADQYQQLGDHDGAVGALERAHAGQPGDLQVTHALAAALVRRSTREDERTRALDLDRVADLLCDVADVLEPSQGRAFLESALQHAPWHARALYELERGTPAAARGELAPRWVAYLAHNPSGDLAAERRVALAVAYINAGQVADAMFALEPAVKSGNLEAAALLAQLRARQGVEIQTTPRAADLEAFERAASADAADDIPPPALRSELELDAPAHTAEALDVAADSGDGADSPAATPAEPLPAATAPIADEISSLELSAVDLLDEDESAPNLGSAALDAPVADPAAELEPEFMRPDDQVAAETQHDERSASALISPPTAATASQPMAAGSVHSVGTSGAATAHAPGLPSALTSAALAALEPDDPEQAFLSDDEPEPEPEASPNDPLSDDALRALRATLSAAHAADDAAQGLEAAERILAQVPSDPEAFDFAERQYRRTRDFRRRAELLLRSARDPELSTPLRKQRLRDAIGLYEQKLLDLDAALAAYRTWAETAEPNDDILRGMARLLERMGRWDELCENLEHSLALQHEPAQQLAILRRLAELHRRERNDRGATADVLARLVEIDANDRAARVALTEDLNALQRWPQLTALLEQRISEASGKSERVALLRQLATVWDEAVHDLPAAYSAYLRLIELAPDDARALERMEAIDEETGAHERLLGTLERRAQRASPAQSASLLVRMATIAEADLLDRGRAYDYLRSAVAQAPNNQQIGIALANLCERAERYPELLELLRERAQVEKQAKLRVELLRRIARLLATQLQDPDAAATAYAELNRSGEDVEAWAFLAGHARERGNNEALSSALQKLSELEQAPSARRPLLLERARLLTQLERFAEAIDPLSRVLLEVDAHDQEARAALGALCERLRDYRGLARVLEELLARTPSAQERAALAQELSLLYAQQLPDDAREIKALTTWSQAAPEEPEAFRRLAAIYKRRRRDKELLHALDALARLEPAESARTTALLSAADLCWNRLKDADGALERISTFLRLSRAPLPAASLEIARKAERLREVCETCEACGRYDELCALLEERIQTSSDPELKASLYQQLATTLIEQRQDEAGALAAYEGLLALRDDIDALRFVQAWAVRHEDDARLADALLRLAGCELSLEDRRDLWMERGRLLRSKLGQPSAAADAFEQALAIDPALSGALDELIVSAEAAREHARLANALERKLASDDPNDDPVSLLRRVANVYEGELADAPRAVSALQRWAELDLGSAEPLCRLRVQYQNLGNPSALLETLDALSEREREPSARSEATISAAELAHDHFGDTDSALARLAPLVAANDPAADRAILRIAAKAGRLDEVYALLAQAGRYADLADQLAIAAESSADPARKAHYFRYGAQVLHTQLNDAARAATAYQALLLLEEDAPALRFMQARALEADDAEAQSEVLLRLSKLETDPNELRDLLFEYAHLQNSRLRKPARALPVLRRILSELDREFEPALDELISAAEAGNDPDSLAFGLTRAFERESDPGRRAELVERLANLYAVELRDPERQRQALLEWIALDPNELTARHKLRAFLQQRAEHPALLLCLDEIAKRSHTRESRQEAALAAAELCAGPLQDPGQAFARLATLLLAGVSQAEERLHELAFEGNMLDALCELYEQHQRYDELCALLRERVEVESDEVARARLLRRCARLLSSTLRDELAAAEAYRELLALVEDLEAISYLRAVAQGQDDVETLDDLLAREIALCAPEQRAELRLTRALLLRDRLGQAERATELLAQLLSDSDEPCSPELRLRVITALEQSARQVGASAALALALEEKLAILQSPPGRRDAALQLAELYEGELQDAALAARALRLACAADPRHLLTLQRLEPHLRRESAWPELLAVLDALAMLTPTQAERRAARLEAARCAQEQLADMPAALERLTPLLLDGDAAAESLAEQVCRGAGLGRELANVYIARARSAVTPQQAQDSWRRVMEIHEQWLGEPAEAFEASLRLLAADPEQPAWLDAVDRLAVAARAAARLAQVYAKLIRAASSDLRRVELSSRLSNLLETQGEDAGTALEFALQAARLSPDTAALIERVAKLAEQQASHGDRLWALEQSARIASDPNTAIAAWLAAASCADLGLRDRESANACLRRALSLTEQAPALATAVENTAAELDRARPELGKADAQRALLRSHLDLADQARPEFRCRLVLRAAQYAANALEDQNGSFDILRAGAASTGFADPVLDALEQIAAQIGRLDALDAQFARAIDRSGEESQVVRLLGRRGRLLAERLLRFDLAAQVYERLLELSPEDASVSALLLGCLRKAGRHRELLRVCERRLLQVSEPAAKLPIMREMASIWEVELKNRPSALAIWVDIQALAPHDVEASQALRRLNGHE